MVSLLVMQKLLVALVVMVCIFIVPVSVGAAGLVPACGGAGEPPCQACHVVVLVNNVVGWLVMILGVIAAILIVVAGARLVTSAGNSSAKEEAKSSMTNLLIGYLIVLAAWLVLDYGLRALLLQDGTYSFGVWNQISCVDQPLARSITVTQDAIEYLSLEEGLGGVQGWVPAGSTAGGSSAPAGSYNAACRLLPGPPGVNEYDCSAQEAQCRAAPGTPTLNAAGSAVLCAPRQVSGGGTGGSLPQCTNTYCSVPALRAAGMTITQANVMSCIAMTESSGNPATPPYNVTHPGSNSSACGLFQIVRTTWNLYNVGGSCSDHATSCQNASCNTRVAVNIVRRNGYNDWTCANCNSRAMQCITRYGG